MVASLSFETPLGGLIALAVAVPLVGGAVAAVRAARGRKLLALGAPPPSSRLTLVLIAAVPVFVALAASGPALSSHTVRHVRTDAQAVFLFDISRSMLASSGVHAPNRLAQARAAAIELRNHTIPDVPSGISTMTTIVLPHLFPTSDLAAFNSGVRDAVAIESPPPPALAIGFPGTSFSSLTPLRTQGYFAPQAKKRIVILLTDGESGPYDPQTVGDALVGDDEAASTLPNQQAVTAQPRVSLFIIRIGGPSDRIYHPDGTIEAAYRPDPRAPEIATTLAEASHGYVFQSSQLGAATTALRRVLGSGPTVSDGTEQKTLALAPFAIIVAFAALIGVVVRRNLVSI
jgi:hypothetical protein